MKYFRNPRIEVIKGIIELNDKITRVVLPTRRSNVYLKIKI